MPSQAKWDWVALSVLMISVSTRNLPFFKWVWPLWCWIWMTIDPFSVVLWVPLGSAALYRGVQKLVILAIHIILRLTYSMRLFDPIWVHHTWNPFTFSAPTSQIRHASKPWDVSVTSGLTCRELGDPECDMLVACISVDCSRGSKLGSWFPLLA